MRNPNFEPSHTAYADIPAVVDNPEGGRIGKQATEMTWIFVKRKDFVDWRLNLMFEVELHAQNTSA